MKERETERTLADLYDLLSSRELQVLELTARGMTNSTAAAQLGITVYAVKFHLASIYRKLGVQNRTAAAVLYSERLRRAHSPIQEGQA